MSEELNKNEQKSHNGGVKTLEGKAISRYNAQRHAILRETATDYEKVNAGQIYNDLVADLKPEGRTQEIIVEAITSDYIRLTRITKAEAQLVEMVLRTRESFASAFDMEHTEGEFSHHFAGSMLLYSRYQTSALNRIYRAIGVLKQLKTYDQAQR
ncbi:MAG: hypothetical protein AAB545_02760 [Patescibacteria group bacterium]